MAGASQQINWSFGRWRKDGDVRGLSLAARGLWFEMLGLMHLSPTRGYLLDHAGRPFTVATMAIEIDRPREEVELVIPEIEASGVFSRDEVGIFCRSMVRDERKRSKCAAAGKRGGGNPNLHVGATFDTTFGDTFKGHSKGQIADDAIKETPCTCGDGQKQLFEENGMGGVGGGLSNVYGSSNARGSSEKTDLFEEETANARVREWIEYKRKEKRQFYKPLGLKALFTRLKRMGPERAVAAIEFSMSNTYDGIHEPHDGGNGSKLTRNLKEARRDLFGV